MQHSEFGTQFYPTPLPLALRMVAMVDWDGSGAVLDVSAGKGDLLAAAALRSCRSWWQVFKGNRNARNNQELQFDEYDFEAIEKLSSDEYFKRDWEDSIKRMSHSLWAIEIDENLQHILRGNGYRVIGSDFFSYSGSAQPSYILMNPPFANGAQFLLRAIDFLYSGQIVCQLNAQTLLNPNTLERQALVKKLSALNARIEYLENQYVNAERPTGVQIALVYIDKRVAMDDAFEDVKEVANDHVHVEGGPEDCALVSSDRIEALVQRFEAQKSAGVSLLLDFHKKSSGLPFIDVSMDGFTPPRFNGPKKFEKTELVKAKINFYLSRLREAHWTEMMNDPAVTRWLTKSKKEQYLAQLAQYSHMDFTVANIRSFVSNISAAYPETLSAAIEDVFDEFTVRNSYHEDTKNNAHYFSGWKSNKSHYVNKKVVLPRMSSYDSFFGRWGSVDYRVKERLSDFEKVMSYFEGGRTDFESMTSLIDKAVKAGQTSKIETEFFFVTVYMKGTMHLTFKDEQLRRRFNVFVGKRRAYLPPGYCSKDYAEMDDEEKAVVQAFEGEKNYKVDLCSDPFSSHSLEFSAANASLKIAA